MLCIRVSGHGPRVLLRGNMRSVNCASSQSTRWLAPAPQKPTYNPKSSCPVGWLLSKQTRAQQGSGQMGVRCNRTLCAAGGTYNHAATTRGHRTVVRRRTENARKRGLKETRTHLFSPAALLTATQVSPGGRRATPSEVQPHNGMSLSLKRGDVLTHATTWTNIEDTRQREKSQVHREIRCGVHFM